jgi:cytosine/adenosine deaminase-related metal-dependent hydrolase
MNIYEGRRLKIQVEKEQGLACNSSHPDTGDIVFPPFPNAHTLAGS